MVVGILQFTLDVHDAQSLKDKRRVVRSLKDRLHREHQVSVAEVGDLSLLNRAELGLTLACGDTKRVLDVLDAITAKLRGLHDAELTRAVRRVVEVAELPDPEVIDESALAAEMLAHCEIRPYPEEPSR